MAATSPASTSAAATPISTPASTTPSPWSGITSFGCVLPVYGLPGLGTGAFVTFPAGSVSPGAEAGYYYDRAVLRWVPVYRSAVSPDGLSYALTEGWSTDPATPPRLHIVKAATRQDQRVVTMPDAQPYQVVDFTNDAVYLVISFEGTAPGVWRVDRATGYVAKISNGSYPPTGAAWIGVVDPRDPHPHQSAFSGAKEPNRIDRRADDGRATTWFYAPGYALSWAAFAGAPALIVSGFRQDNPNVQSVQAYWLVDSPGHATRLRFAPGSTSDLVAGFGSAIADAHGIWIGGSYLYLVQRDGTLIRALATSAYPANGCS
jgi:hypothetical protein